MRTTFESGEDQCSEVNKTGERADEDAKGRVLQFTQGGWGQRADTRDRKGSRARPVIKTVPRGGN